MPLGRGKRGALRRERGEDTEIIKDTADLENEAVATLLDLLGGPLSAHSVPEVAPPLNWADTCSVVEWPHTAGRLAVELVPRALNA